MAEKEDRLEAANPSPEFHANRRTRGGVRQDPHFPTVALELAGEKGGDAVDVHLRSARRFDLDCLLQAAQHLRKLRMAILQQLLRDESASTEIESINNSSSHASHFILS